MPQTHFASASRALNKRPWLVMLQLFVKSTVLLNPQRKTFVVGVCIRTYDIAKFPTHFASASRDLNKRPWLVMLQLLVVLLNPLVVGVCICILWCCKVSKLTSRLLQGLGTNGHVLNPQHKTFQPFSLCMPTWSGTHWLTFFEEQSLYQRIWIQLKLASIKLPSQIFLCLCYCKIACEIVVLYT